MIFTELNFLYFIAIVFTGYWAIPSLYGRKLFLIGASAFFYGYWDYRFLALLFVVIISCYTAARIIALSDSEVVRRRVLLVAVFFNLGLLGVFKYFNFFVDSFISAFSTFGLTLSQPTLSIILPVGISFYIFQGIGYVVDVSRDRGQCREKLTDVALFVAFFPQLVAGPIVRAGEFMPQLDQRHRLSDLPIKGIIILFLGGFFKKAVIADNVALVVDPIFANPQLYSPTTLTLGVVMYAVQIYCDFSGYSDMAIAVSRLFGYRLPLNFRAPYFAPNLTVFWRRWHISLSNWLRDYLYITLGGNRGSVLNTYRNLFLTMLLGGLWHGSTWNFVIWGALHGGALAYHRYFFDGKTKQIENANVLSYAWHVRGVLITFVFVCACWIPFRAQDLETTLFIFGQLLTWSSAGIDLAISPLWWWALLAVIVMHMIVYFGKIPDRMVKQQDWLFYPIIGVWIAIILPFMRTEAAPFIYFQF